MALLPTSLSFHGCSDPDTAVAEPARVAAHADPATPPSSAAVAFAATVHADFVGAAQPRPAPHTPPPLPCSPSTPKLLRWSRVCAYRGWFRMSVKVLMRSLVCATQRGLCLGARLVSEAALETRLLVWH